MTKFAAARSLLSQDSVYASFYTLSGSPVTEPSRFSFADRVGAAAETGITGIGLSAQDYLSMTHTQGPSELRQILDASGVELYEVEFLYGWDAPDRPDRLNFYEDRLLEMAEELGARQLNVGSLLPTDAAPRPEQAAEAFSAICTRAQSVGLRVALEPMAMSYLKTVAQADEIVSLAAAANAGVLVDSYHFFRGEDDLEALAMIPPHHIIGVQINDASLPLSGDLFEDCVTKRLLPGEGDFDLEALLVKLDEMGVVAPLTVETMSDRLRVRPVSEAAAQTRYAVDALRLRARRRREGEVPERDL